jgi:WD40-like Beta Propeller Repeat
MSKQLQRPRKTPNRASEKPRPGSVNQTHGRVRRVRTISFAALVVLCIVVGAAYVLHAKSREEDAAKNAVKAVLAGPGSAAKFASAPHVVFRSTSYGPSYGRVALAPLSEPSGPRAVTTLTCDRVDMSNGVGLCLVADRGVLTTYEGEIFDRHFAVRHHFDLPGLPSRARVSPDGRLAAMTVFVSGDSYAAANFSTRTMFVDTRTGNNLGNLEEFEVTNDGAVVDAIDRNYWGVTFGPDSNRFYATLSYGGNIYLIQGNVAQRTAHVIGEHVECPSLSPDGKRIAYKLRSVGDLGAITWRLHVLDLQSGADQALAETRSVDDQVEWRNDDEVLYSLPKQSSGTAETETWSVPADGSGKPTVLVPLASSPSVVQQR